MSYEVGDVEGVESVRYDGEALESVEGIFERLYAPTRRMARDFPEIHTQGTEDSYQNGFFGGGELRELEEQQQAELERDITVELSLKESEKPVEYTVRQINDNNKRYASNAPCSVLLDGENGDRFVLHEAKNFVNSEEAFHFGAGNGIETYLENDQNRGHLPMHGFFEGLKEVYSDLESADGFSPLILEVGVVHDTDGYDEKTDQQTYYLRDFDEQAIMRDEFPETGKLAEFAATLDTLGIRRADASPQEMLHSDEGFLYDADLEKLILVDPEGDEQPGMSRVRDIFDRVHGHPNGGRLKLDGERAYTEDIIAAIEEEYPSLGDEAVELRERFRDGISEWDPEDLSDPFIDLR